jgi:hypothetical protein
MHMRTLQNLFYTPYRFTINSKTLSRLTRTVETRVSRVLDKANALQSPCRATLHEHY